MKLGFVVKTLALVGGATIVGVVSFAAGGVAGTVLGVKLYDSDTLNSRQKRIKLSFENLEEAFANKSETTGPWTRWAETELAGRVKDAEQDAEKASEMVFSEGVKERLMQGFVVNADTPLEEIVEQHKIWIDEARELTGKAILDFYALEDSSCVEHKDIKVVRLGQDSKGWTILLQDRVRDESYYQVSHDNKTSSTQVVNLGKNRP